MKRIICIIILIVGLVFIGGVTTYTLSHKEVKNKVIENVTKNIEEVTYNLSGDTYQQIYNVYIDNQKHKLKLMYSISMINDTADVRLMVYFDGVSIINQKVASNLVGEDIEDIVASRIFVEHIKFSDKRIAIKKLDNKEYILLDVGYYNDSYKEYYYIFDDAGELILDDGFLVVDESVNYISDDERELDIFYDKNNQVYTKIENNSIYTLIPNENNDNIKLKEYKYIIKDGNIEKELLNTYLVIKRDNLQASQID